MIRPPNTNWPWTQGRLMAAVGAWSSFLFGIIIMLKLFGFSFWPCGYQWQIQLTAIGIALAGAWLATEGKTTVYANLGGQQLQGEITKKDRRRAAEFVNLLFELKQQ